MKIGKIMLVTLLLLAILTIGSVNASDDADFNETLAVDNWGGEEFHLTLLLIMS